MREIDCLRRPMHSKYSFRKRDLKIRRRKKVFDNFRFWKAPKLWWHKISWINLSEILFLTVLELAKINAQTLLRTSFHFGLSITLQINTNSRFMSRSLEQPNCEGCNVWFTFAQLSFGHLYKFGIYLFSRHFQNWRRFSGIHCPWKAFLNLHYAVLADCEVLVLFKLPLNLIKFQSKIR